MQSKAKQLRAPGKSRPSAPRHHARGPAPPPGSKRNQNRDGSLSTKHLARLEVCPTAAKKEVFRHQRLPHASDDLLRGNVARAFLIPLVSLPRSCRILGSCDLDDRCRLGQQDSSRPPRSNHRRSWFTWTLAEAASDPFTSTTLAPEQELQTLSPVALSSAVLTHCRL